MSNEDQSVLFCYLKRSQARKNNNVRSTKERGSLRSHHHIPLAPSKPKITYLGKVRTRVARRNEEREMANIVNCSHKIWKELMSEIPNPHPSMFSQGHPLPLRIEIPVSNFQRSVPIEEGIPKRLRRLIERWVVYLGW